MRKIARQLTELIGSTPLLELTRFSTAKGLLVPLVAKIEYFNPGGSVKDRPARQMLLDALIRHRWKPAEAARALGISRATLYRRAHEHPIEMPRVKG